MRPRTRLPALRHVRRASWAPRGRTPVIEAVRENLASDEADGALRVDNERGTVSAAGRELPLSPLMDEGYLEHVHRSTGRKDRAKGEPVGRFRKLLKKNPYGSFSSPVAAVLIP